MILTDEQICALMPLGVIQIDEKYQFAMDVAKLTREETLKEVGEWLQLCDCTTTPHSKRISVDFDDVMKITNGEMPE